ncbi:MAG: hypothetical protein WC876_10885 [Candidatus Thermoplasmatota archaeon]|jgi:hypothetical protein
MEPNHDTGQQRETRAAKASHPPESTHVQASSDVRPPPTSAAERRAAPPQTRQVLEEPASMLDVNKAMKEITRVPAATIHRTAAYAWASRAIAGYRVCAAKTAVQEGLSYLYLGEHYREAALAHAAMGEAWQPLFAEIEQAMAEDRTRAFASLRGRSSGATR